MPSVLIVDDDVVICDVLRLHIEKMNHRVRYAHILAEELEEVTTNAFDVVFLDVGMPDGSGLDLTPKIRNTVSSPEIIIMTGLGNPDGAEMAIRSGAWDYVT